MPINNALQSFWVNTGAFPWLSLEKSNEIREQSKLMSSNPYNQKLIQDDLHRQELNKKTHQDFMDQRQAGRMQLEQQVQTTKSSSKKNRTNSVKKMWALADMYRQYWYEHGKNWDSMWDEELVSRFNTKNPQVKQYADAFLTWGDESEYRLAQELGINGESSTWLDEKAKKDLKDNLWDEVRGSIKTKVNVPINSVKKWGQRTLNELWSNLYKEILKDAVWDSVLDDLWIDIDKSMDKIYEKTIDPMVSENVVEYQNKVNENYRALEEKNMNQNVQRYYDNQWYTKLLKSWDLRWFLYKTVWDAAQNWEMPAVVAVSVLQPEVWFALMATDTYARENQEAFEAMMDNWATYDQAERWAVVVWLVNSAVEVWLEKLIWWVETWASKAIRDAFMKNVQEEAVKKWLGRLLTEWALQQLKASWEEWLEEIVQTIVQNAAIKTVNQNQDLFEWVGQAFEWGFYNPMNLLVWGWNLAANRTAIRDSIRGRWYNTTTDTNTSTNTNTNNQNQGILDRITDWGAEKITGTVSAQDKLYKAQEPRMNTLTSKKDLERRRWNSDRANQLIVENGYTPTNTAERLEAHKATLDKIWNQVKSKINEWKWVTVDQTSIINALENYINEKKNLNVAAIEWDIAALEKELESLKQSQEQWTADLPVLENKKQVYNDIANWKEHEASKVYNDWIKLITSEIWKIEDNLLSQIPWEFSNLKKDVGALIDSYEDVFKADMKNQRSKWMWITEAYSRIEWVWDIIEGAMWIFKWEWSKVLKWAGKVLLWKSLAKARDVDFLIEQWFKELANNIDSKSVDKTSTNDYTTTNASSNTSSVNLSLNGEETAWTESSSSWATPQGWDQVWPTTAFSQERRSGKTPTRWSNFDISNVKQEYSDNFDKIMEWKLDIWEIWRVEGKVAFDWKERPAIFSAEIKEKIERDHWIDKANMLWTLEKPDYIIKNMNWDTNRINIIRRIPWTNNFVLLAADRSNWFFVVTNYETHNNTNNRMKNELKRLIKRWELVVDNVWDIGSVLNSESTNMQETEQAGEATKKNPSKEQDKTPTVNNNITRDSEWNTLSKEDQEKFGNSKIVDGEWNLLVVMHGSANQEVHDHYDETKAGSNVHADFKWVYFTDNLDLAEQFAHEQLPWSSAFRTVLWKRGHLYKSYVNITNPLNLNTATPEQLLPFFREDVLTKTRDEEKRLDNLRGHPQFVKFHVDMDKVEKAWYDGIIAAIGKEWEWNEYIVFKGNQAKNIWEIEEQTK